MNSHLFFAALMLATSMATAKGSRHEFKTFECVHPVSKAMGACFDLTNEDLSGLTLDNMDFSRARMVNTSLVKASLKNSHLIEADLARANFTEANLFGASLYGADFNFTNLSGADLRGTNLIAANLEFAIITDTTKLNGSHFNKATKLPTSWGSNWDQRRSAATLRGMLPVRE